MSLYSSAILMSLLLSLLRSTSFADMKKVWIARKFTYIFEAITSNLAFFMQSLYAHSIGYMVSVGSLSLRLGGLYCLYCLYETQPFKPPFKIYLSIGEMKKLKDLVGDAKESNIKVVVTLVNKMLEKNIFLFGFMDANESSATQTVNQLTELQNARIQVAYKKLFSNTQIENFLHMDLGMEVDVNAIKKMSNEYAQAKKIAINEGSRVVDVGDIKHIAEEEELIGDAVEKTSEDWNVQREILYQQTGLNQQLTKGQHELEEQHHNVENFDLELERILSEA